MPWFRPVAAMIAVAFVAVAILGSAPAWSRMRIISTSSTEAASRKGVAPTASVYPVANEGWRLVIRAFTFAPWASRAFTSRSLA